MKIADISINKKYCLISFIFFLNKNINFCCPFCCGFDSFNIIQINPENENNENENNENEIDSKKKGIFKKYEPTEEKWKEYEKNKEQLSSLGDEIFWKYFLGKLAVNLILKKENEGKENKEKEKEKIENIFKEYVDQEEAFVNKFFEKKSQEDIKGNSKKNIFDVSLDDIIFFAFLFIENVYLNKRKTVPLSLDARKYFALKNLCTFYLKPEEEIKTKYVLTRELCGPADIKEFFDDYIKTLKKDLGKSSNILKNFNTICEYKRSCLMWLFMAKEDLVEYLFKCKDLIYFINTKRMKDSANISFDILDELLTKRFWHRFNNEPFKFNNQDFNEKFKKIVFDNDFFNDLWVLYGQEVINSILETNSTNVTNKKELDIKKNMNTSVENNDKKAKNKLNITNQDEILKFEHLKIHVGVKPEEDSFLNGFLIGLLNYRTDLVNIFKDKIKISNNEECSWKDWLSTQNKNLGAEEINFEEGFSELTNSNGVFVKELTQVDKYFCRMLLFLFKILSEENGKIINGDFSNLKSFTRQFFHVKKKLKKVDGEFNVPAPVFYNTLFSFMELMYQKFLGDQGICGKINDNKGKKENINNIIENSINNEQNLIRLFFGFYYIDVDKENVFLKHLYCGEVDNKKGNVTLTSLDNLYSEKYIVASYCSNLIVPIQNSCENNITSNREIQINICKYMFKMVLNPGYDFSMIYANQNVVKKNGCSFFMLDDLSARTINFVFGKILTKSKNSVENFINTKNVKNFLQEKYVTYFFVKKIDKEDKDGPIWEKYIPFDNKIQNNKDSLIKGFQEKLGEIKENIKKDKKVCREEENIEQKCGKIKNFYYGSEDKDNNCSSLFVLPKYKGENNIFKDVQDWKKFMNIINNNEDILQEEKNNEGENNINANEIHTNVNALNNEGYIKECLGDYLTKITNLILDDQNFVYLLLSYTNSLYKKLLKIINGEIENKKRLCLLIFNEINKITKIGKPLEFDNFDFFIEGFNSNLENKPNPDSTVGGNFYEKWKNFMDKFPFFIQNSLLLYGVSLVLKNISEKKDDQNDKNVINQQIEFGIKLLQVKDLLFSNLLGNNNEIYKNLIPQSLPNQSKEKKNSINKSKLKKSLEECEKNIDLLSKKFIFKKQNIFNVLNKLKKYNENDVNIVENVKKQELEQLEKNINDVKMVVDTYLNFVKAYINNKIKKENKNENENENESLVDVLVNEKYFVNSFNEKKEGLESPYFFIIQFYIGDLEKNIKELNSKIDNLLFGKNPTGIMKRIFFLFANSQNNNGSNRNDSNKVFQKTYEEFLEYYNELSKQYEEKEKEEYTKNKEVKNKEEEIANGQKEENKEDIKEKTNTEDNEKIVWFKQNMFNILLSYIFNSDIAGGRENELDEQIKNMWKNKEEYFNDLLFGLNNSGSDCFINSSIQLLLRCWDGFEEISNYQNNNNNIIFFTWLSEAVKRKIRDKYPDSLSSNKLEISLKFIYNFFNFGKKVKEVKECLLNKNKLISREDAKAFSDKMKFLHSDLVRSWRDYAVFVEKDDTFSGQSDTYDALRLFFNCLTYVMYCFESKRKPISMCLVRGRLLSSKNIDVSVEWLYCRDIIGNRKPSDKEKHTLSIDSFDSLKLITFLKNACLDKIPFWGTFFGTLVVRVDYCSLCNRFSASSYFSCLEHIHINDFIFKTIEPDYNSLDCFCSASNSHVTTLSFFVPIGKYLFIGNADAATNKDLGCENWNSKVKYLESWKDKIYKFGENNSYRNIGVSVHSGSVGEKSGGHYWAYIRSRYLNSLYFECNDSLFPYDKPVSVYTHDSDKHERVYLFEKIDNK